MIIRRGLAVVLTVVVASAAACGSGKNLGRETTTSQVTTTTTVATGTSTSVQTSTTATTPAVGASAYNQLAEFITAARAFDAQLRTAARAINATGPPWPTVAPAVTAAVKAADPVRLAATLPAGLPPALLQKAVTVYSELLSRRYAMNDFAYPQEGLPPPWDAQHQTEMLSALANGHEAARRFPADIVELERAARATPPFAPQSPTSRSQAELLLILDLVRKAENGCDSRGGVIFDKVPVIEWRAGEYYGQHPDGFIDGTPFTANLVSGTWQIDINAC